MDLDKNDLEALRKALINCTRHIKSNDDTFKISTLSLINQDITDIMKSYTNTQLRMQASQHAYETTTKELNNMLDERTEEQEGIYIDDMVYKQKLEINTTNELNRISRKSGSGFEEIDALINPESMPDLVEEIQETEFQIPRDPITQHEIGIAVKSKKCNHIYDKEGIEKYFEQKAKTKKSIRCPHIGCSNKQLTREQIVIDDATNAKIEKVRTSRESRTC